MSSSEFKFIAIEIPKDITLKFIQNVKKAIANISSEDAELINKIINLDTSDVTIDDVCEEDLFKIGEESLKVKKAIHNYLEEAASAIFLPRVNISKRIGTEINDKGFAYLPIENKLYVVSGNQTGYFGSKDGEAYHHLLALNMSGVLNEN
jgi:hypothetical protein